MSMDANLAAQAERTHGVFRLEHAAALGLTRHQIARRIATGRWTEAHYGVYRIAGVPPTWQGDLLAACWAGGIRAVASRRSAAALHGLPGGTRDVVEITCPRWRRARHEGLLVHETRALAAADVTIVDGIPVTTVARTLFDLGACYGIGMVELALDRALSRGLVTLDELDVLVRRVSRRGRPGGPNLRQLLEARRADRRPTESVMETKLLQAIRAAGLPEPVSQFEVWAGAAFIARVDFAYPDVMVAIEYDSDEHHTGRNATRRDRARRYELIAAGWLPIDVGPAELRQGGVAVCAAIADALRRRSGARTAG
jgi:very-short-patch-repair endonuclease